MMNAKHKGRKGSSQGRKKARPVPTLMQEHSKREEDIKKANSELRSVNDEIKTELPEDTQDQEEASQALIAEAERFIEISKYFSSPLRKTASYICENHLISYPNPYRIEYKRNGVTTQHIKFSNLTLEPVYIKLYKVIPDLEQLKYINLSLSRCKRIPPGLSFNLGFVYDDVNEKPACNAKMIFVASRKTTTPCYQICEIDLVIEAQKIKLNSR